MSIRRPFAVRLLIALLLLVAAAAAHARTFTVTLTNGMTFETRYRPVQSDFDPEISLIMTDRGNWVALRNDEIADVVSEAEASGYGYQLDTTTLYLGWSPNDLVDDEAGEDGTASEPRYEVDAPATSSNYNLDQFLSFSGTDPGSGNAGVPLYVEGNADPN